MTEEIKRERTSKRPAKGASRPRANTTTAAIYHPPQQIKPTRASACLEAGSLGSVTTAAPIRQQQQNQFFQGSQVIDTGRRVGAKNILATQQISKTMMGTGILQGDADMEWSQFTKTETVVEAAKITNLSQAITVTLSDGALEEMANSNGGIRSGGGYVTTAKPDIALTITLGDDGAAHQATLSTTGQSMTNLVHAFRQNSLDEGPQRQLLRVKTNAGHVQEVAVPIPMPIRVVLRANKDSQTETEPMPIAATNCVQTSTLASGMWMDTPPMKQDQVATTLDDFMALGEVNAMLQEQQMQPHQLQQMQPISVAVPQQNLMITPEIGQPNAALSPSDMLNYFQPNDASLMMNSGQKVRDYELPVFGMMRR